MGMLTAIQIRSFKEPGRYSDGEGLILNLISPGRGSWMVRVQAKGKRRDIGLGALADIGFGEAREAARKIRKDTKAGIDVLAERKQERIVVPTFRDAAKQVHAEHKAAWKNGKHQAQWIATLETYVFPALGDRLVAEIEQAELLEWFNWATVRGGPGAGNRALEILRAMFNHAERWGVRSKGSNPCRFIRPNKRRKCERFLSSQEVARLGEVLAEASLPGVRIHDLRHSFASHAASQSETLPMIGKLLGHVRLATTS